MKYLKKPNLLELLLYFSPFYKYKISGNSMKPVLKDGDYVLVNRLAYIFKTPQVDDIIAALDPRDKKTLIKRITKIQNGKYVIQGDNKNFSTDSRNFGMIEKKSIIGKVILNNI